MQITSPLKKVRVIAALICFVLITAALADFRNLVPPGLAHWATAVQFVPASMALATGALVSGVAVLAILLLTLLFGRVYCSVICPLGVFQDVISRISKALQKSKRPLPFRSRKTLLRQLFLWLLVGGIILGWGGFALSLLDPYSNYGRFASSLFRPLITLANNSVVGTANAIGMDSLYRVNLPWPGIGALLGPGIMFSIVAVMSALRGRLYCNTVCPVGTVLGLVSRKAAFRIAIDKSACTKCGACFRACKAQCIDLRKNEIDFDRCVACYDCVSVCDDHGIGYQFQWGKSKPSVDAVEETKTAEPVKADMAGSPDRRDFLRRSASGLALSVSLPLLAKTESHEREGHPDKSAKDHGVRSVAITPPGSVSVERFLERCTSCQLCISACPSHVLQPAFLEYGLKGFMKPRMDFAAAFCDYDCVRCAEVCPDGAITLLPVVEKQQTQIGVAHFDKEHCIVHEQNTDCAACSEHCPTKAVYTVPFGENLRIPEVNQELCIGCGACEYACPVKPQKAITVSGLGKHGHASRAAQKAAPKPAESKNDFPF